MNACKEFSVFSRCGGSYPSRRIEAVDLTFASGGYVATNGDTAGKNAVATSG